MDFQNQGPQMSFNPMNFKIPKKFVDPEPDEDSDVENSDDESLKPFLAKETEKFLLTTFQDKPVRKIKEYNKLYPRPTKVLIAKSFVFDLLLKKSLLLFLAIAFHENKKVGRAHETVARR